MADEWYYSRDHQRLGPVSTDELRRIAATGDLRATDLVWAEGMADWTPAGRVGGLLPRRPGPPAGPAGQEELLSGRAHGSSGGQRVWHSLILTGAVLMLPAFFVPWWGMTGTTPRQDKGPRTPSRDGLGRGGVPDLSGGVGGGKNPFGELDALKERVEEGEKAAKRNARVLKEGFSWTKDYAGSDKSQRFAEQLQENGSASVRVWGWHTVAGSFGLVTSVLAITAAVAVLTVRVVRPWGWAGAFGSAVPALVTLILSAVFLFSCPSEGIEDTLSQGASVGPYLALVAGGLVLASGIAGGVTGLVSSFAPRQPPAAAA